MGRRNSFRVLAVAVLAAVSGSTTAGATFPGSDGRLAVIRLIPETGSAVTTMEPDGSDREQVFMLEGFRNFTVDVDWSADATRLAVNVCCGRDIPHAIVSIAADGSDLVGAARKGEHPAWSPDGSTIAFDRFGRNDRGRFWSWIFLADADGGHVQRFTGETSPRASSPAWSPDGSAIAYSRLDRQQVAVKPVAGGPAEAFDLPQGIDYADHLEWSPDGSTLSFIGHTCSGECGDVWTLAVGTGTFTRLTRTQAAEETDADWSPQGTTIVYVRFDDAGFESSDLWFMDPDGTDKRALETPRLEFGVDWGTVPDA